MDETTMPAPVAPMKWVCDRCGHESTDEDEECCDDLGDAGLELLRKKRQLKARVVALEERRDALLETVRRISQETPLPEEVSEALAQRGVLLAEIGTLKAKLAEAERTICDLKPPADPRVRTPKRPFARRGKKAKK